MNDDNRILVAGGGICGLAVARALHCHGYEVRVFERAAELSEAGSGLAVQPNGMMALRRLDLEDSVRERGVVLARATIMRRDGVVLSRLDMERATRDVGAPMVGLLRRELLGVLANSLPPGILELGAEVRSFAVEESGVCVRLGGREERGAALVGCDGLQSRVRHALLADGEPVYAGYTSWRGLCDRNGLALRDELVEMWGRGRRFGFVPVSRADVYWFAVDNAPPDGVDADVKGDLLRAFSGWHAPVESLLRATPTSQILRTDIRDRDPVWSWGRATVTLAGDAAHPMTPNLGQGASMAVEDAVVLASSLVTARSVEQGLRDYEQQRFARTASIVRRSRSFGRVAQGCCGPGARLRDTLVRVIPDAVMRWQTRKLWTFDL